MDRGETGLSECGPEEIGSPWFGDIPINRTPGCSSHLACSLFRKRRSQKARHLGVLYHSREAIAFSVDWNPVSRVTIVKRHRSPCLRVEKIDRQSRRQRMLRIN